LSLRLPQAGAPPAAEIAPRASVDPRFLHRASHLVQSRRAFLRFFGYSKFRAIFRATEPAARSPQPASPWRGQIELFRPCATHRRAAEAAAATNPTTVSLRWFGCKFETR